MQAIKTAVTLDGNFLYYEGTILNRVEVAEANAANGWVLMRSGHEYWLRADALRAWFADTMDYAKVMGGKPDDAPKKARKVWLVFHEEHEAGYDTETEVAHVCDSRLKAEEWLERDAASITNLKGSEVKSDCYKGSAGDIDYRYYIKEMEVEA